jgi:hypothetical protein
VPITLSALVSAGLAMALLFSQVGEPQTRVAPYHVHHNITSTVFWIGESGYGAGRPIANAASALDDEGMAHYGGVDDPGARDGHVPATFTPTENPFYCALPYHDFVGGRRKSDASAVVPWAGQREWDAQESMCKNRWVRITKGDRTAYAQWEDVGPFETDDAAYVFGTSPPVNQQNDSAGLDVSPAVRDYLGLEGLDKVDWQFVEAEDVPEGPWLLVVTTSQIMWR